MDDVRDAEGRDVVDVKLYLGDCQDVLPTLQANSVDAVITDPPYPCIKRDYGYWTVEEWWELIVEGVIPEVRRILKPTGSAVFILQPNSEHVGQMRGWLWEFMAWVCREWNMVQDVWWWNIVAMPGRHVWRSIGLMRPSLKCCVWAGKPNCYRFQEAILWTESQRNEASRYSRRAIKGQVVSPSGWNLSRQINLVAVERGGVTPFNVLPLPNSNSRTSAGAHGHGAGTPLKLADWWTRYIVPPGGTLCDPFVGSGTMGVAAVENDCSFIGIDIHDIEIAKARIAKAQAEMVQLSLT